MSILIKGAEMPSKGCKTINIHANGTVYVHGAYPTELHKAIPVPTPHGRLIDADKFEVHDGWLSEAEGYSTHITFVYTNAIDLAPTVIEAEEGQE